MCQPELNTASTAWKNIPRFIQWQYNINSLTPNHFPDHTWHKISFVHCYALGSNTCLKCIQTQVQILISPGISSKKRTWNSRARLNFGLRPWRATVSQLSVRVDNTRLDKPFLVQFKPILFRITLGLIKVLSIVPLIRKCKSSYQIIWCKLKHNQIWI